MADRAENLAAVISFLMWQRESKSSAFWGGYPIEEAVTPFSELVGLSVEQMDRIAGTSSYRQQQAEKEVDHD